jgi:hypothetical protein
MKPLGVWHHERQLFGFLLLGASPLVAVPPIGPGKQCHPEIGGPKEDLAASFVLRRENTCVQAFPQPFFTNSILYSPAFPVYIAARISLIFAPYKQEACSALGECK